MSLRSVWENRRPDQPPEEGPEVAGHHDVVVVGGGITGLTTALLLSAAGRSVLVVEAQHVGAGTTGGSTAKVSVLQGTRLGSIARGHSSDVVRQYVQANLEGAAWLRRFCGEHDVAVQSRTACTYATSEKGARSVRQEHRLAVDAGLPARLVEETALPFATTAAVELADQFQVDPVELVGALAAEVRRRGAEVVEGVRVLKVRSGDPMRVETARGTATARDVVVATNMPVTDRGGWFARMRPERSYSVAFAADDLPELPGMYLSADGPSRSVRDGVTGGARYLLVGGEGHTTGRGSRPYGARLDALRTWTDSHFPGLTETHAWSAQDYVPAHQLPVAGPVLPGAEHLLLAGGFAKWGMSNGPAAALAIAGQLLGGRLDWADALRPWSRREVAGLPRMALDNAEVGLEMSRGWLAPFVRPGPAPAEGEGVLRPGRRGPVAVSRVDGSEHAVSAVCSHLGGVVRWNDAERSWDCPLHGSRFGPDGQVLEGPATCALRPR